MGQNNEVFFRKEAIMQFKMVNCVVFKLAFRRKVSLIRLTDMMQQHYVWKNACSH